MHVYLPRPLEGAGAMGSIFIAFIFRWQYLCSASESNILINFHLEKCCKNWYNEICYLISLFLLCCPAEGSRVCVHFSKRHFVLVFLFTSIVVPLKHFEFRIWKCHLGNSDLWCWLERSTRAMLAVELNANFSRLSCWWWTGVVFTILV